MRKAWILDTETKGTGAHVAPLEEATRKPEPRRRRPRKEAPSGGQPKPAARSRASTPRTSASPLPAGHVRKKATGEIGRVVSVDPRAGTATVRWLRGGTTSTLPLSALARR